MLDTPTVRPPTYPHGQRARRILRVLRVDTYARKRGEIKGLTSGLCLGWERGFKTDEESHTQGWHTLRNYTDEVSNCLVSL